MKKNQWVIHTFFAVICAVSLYKPSFAEPANLGLLKTEVKAYHDSGAYQKELANVINNADHFIVTTAEANAKQAHPKKLAIVLDIDETSLSNYNRMVRRDFSGTREQFHQDILAADATVIAPMLSLYKDASLHNVAIFFVTGRPETERTATEKNLQNAGYQRWAKLYHKPNDYNQPSVIPFKSNTRAMITKEGYTIIASIGDQYSDLKGGYAQKTFKLPNPYYYLP